MLPRSDLLLDTFAVNNYEINEKDIAWKTDRDTKFQ